MDLPLHAMTPRLRGALIEAAHQASLAGHRHLGTEHVLLALDMDGDGIAGQVLTHLGVREAVQARLAEVLPTIAGEAEADRLRRRPELAAEVASLDAADDDRDEMRSVASMMEALRPPG